MTKFILMAGATTLLLTACGTVPPEWKNGGSDAETTKTVELTDPDRKVCKKTKVSGSQFDKKVCMTAKEWWDMEEAAKDGLRDIQNGSARNHRGANNG